MNFKINKEFNLKVYENGEVWSLDSERQHSSGVGVCKKLGRRLSFTPNGAGFLIANISLRRQGASKPKTLLLHRLVWCTFNDKSYNCKEKITHIDGDGGNNCYSNLKVKVNKVKEVRTKPKSLKELDKDEYKISVKGGLLLSFEEWRLKKYEKSSMEDTFEIVMLRNGR